jgi:hypothetical protein
VLKNDVVCENVGRRTAFYMRRTGKGKIHRAKKNRGRRKRKKKKEQTWLWNRMRLRRYNTRRT